MYCNNCCMFIAAVAAALHSVLSCPSLKTRWEMFNAPGLEMPLWIHAQLCLGVGNYAQAPLHVHSLWIMTQTVQYWETQIHSDSFLFFPAGGRNNRVHLFFYFSPPFIFFSKESRPLAVILLLSFSVVGMEADGSWLDGGIVLTVELM